MGTAYTPGLTISADIVVRKMRRLPLKGQVLVQVGEPVSPNTVVARTELPGPITTLRVAEQLGVEPRELSKFLLKQVGDKVQAGEVVAERKSLFGLFTSRVISPVTGTVDFISETTGNIGIRHLPTPVEVTAYLRGLVVDVIPEEGAVVATRGVFVQGIFGLSGERHGTIAILANSPDELVPDTKLSEEHKGKVAIAGSLAHWRLMEAARQVGVAALVTGGVLDTDIKRLLGYDIGVAITGHEPLPFTLIVTEGFGKIGMAKRTFELLASQEGKEASVNGATQIRAGVIRPEIVVPKDGTLTMEDLQAPDEDKFLVGELNLGTPVRLIRTPYFGALGRVTSLPPEPQEIETETKTRVLEAELVTGEKVIVPRANVEIFPHE
ncbi:MAG: hypothetical protein N3B10_09800 [Armatimonadetes bacterium]|nr:hypothetical protein [Armatimonadota bacterium]MCX7968761.1 hypothetical protein [Armatimonadota bacterium]MDW8143442.1 hypothetical protein [Armatimonadota bacterium]